MQRGKDLRTGVRLPSSPPLKSTKKVLIKKSTFFILITIIVYDDKGRELNMSTGSESENKIYTQINELVDIGEIPKYIDILVCKNYGDEDNTLSSFRVNLE